MAKAPQVLQLLIFIVFAAFSRTTRSEMSSWAIDAPKGGPSRYCLSWRLAVEANNVRAWRTVPMQCLRHVENYITGNQYKRDLDLIIDQIGEYVDGIDVLGNGMDAWILDVDDTCISNLLYYRGKRYGCDPFDAPGFKAWAMRSECLAIPAVLGLFRSLIEAGFKVILLTGRDEESLGEATIVNLRSQGYIGYERLIMRSADYRGQSAVTYKSAIRKQLVEQGYRIWGNVGDQWSDIQAIVKLRRGEDKMNDTDVSKQIQQMIRFIRQEAEEKANEISVSAEEEFNIEKMQIMEVEKKKICQEFDRKSKQVEVRKKIEYSMQLNASRLKFLQAQDDVVNSLKESASKGLLNVSSDKQGYKKLLKSLIVQCLLRLKEPVVLLRCREMDRNLVQSVLDEAKKEYAEKAQVHSPDIHIDSVFLPPPPQSANSHEPSCSGGVVLASKDGKIVCENTLDARLDVVFKQKLPEIRKRLAA